MRESAKAKPQNAYVVSAQLDKASYDKLQELVKASGLDKSKLLRSIIMGASVNHKRTVAKEETPANKKRRTTAQKDT